MQSTPQFEAAILFFLIFSFSCIISSDLHRQILPIVKVSPNLGGTLLFAKVYFEEPRKDQTEAKWTKKEEKNLPLCTNCGNPIDGCKCVCPYCGESSSCECCTGYGKATGG
jgi:hypothetical protein